MSDVQERPPREADPSSRTSRTGATSPVDLTFFVVALATTAVLFHQTRHLWFDNDEWAMADQVREPMGLLRPYNGHLSLGILAMYRVLLGLVGFTTHTPYRLLGVLAYVSMGVTFHLTTRSRLSPVLAAFGGAALLWGSRMLIVAGGLNHWMSATGGIVCAWGLAGRGRRRDLAVAGGLTGSLVFAGGGVAVAAAAIVFSLLARATWRRWATVAVPTAGWLVWHQQMVPPEAPLITASRPGQWSIVTDAAGHVLSSFSSLAMGNRVGGWVVLAAFLVVGARRASQSLAAAAPYVAWSSALVVWWLGLVWSRWLFLDDVFRYEHLSALFILLAVVPTQAMAPIRMPTVVASWRGAVAVGVFAVILGALAWGDLQSSTRFFAGAADGKRTQVAALGIEEARIPGSDDLGGVLALFDAGRIRLLLSIYGPPGFYGDAAYAATHGSVVFKTTVTDRPATCRDATRPRLLPPKSAVKAWSSGPAVVEVSRFGSSWVPAAQLRGGELVTVWLADLNSPVAWNVRVRGGCTS